MNWPVVSNLLPGEGHDVVHVLLCGPETASDGYPEELLVVHEVHGLTAQVFVNASLDDPVQGLLAGVSPSKLGQRSKIHTIKMMEEIYTVMSL
jgi:hypothetical protein